MKQTAKEFLASWVHSYIYAEPVTVDEIDSKVEECVSDADESGISRDDLEKESSGLRTFILAAIEKMDR